jgi:hypothetical protein
MNLPESPKQGKQQVFLQTESVPLAAIQAKQHAFARELEQQPQSSAVAELTVRLRMSTHMITIEVVVFLPATCLCYLAFVLRGGS